MIVLREPAAVGLISAPDLRQLLGLRFSQLLAGDADWPGCLLVVEAGDNVQQLEQEIGLPILHGLFDDAPFGHPDFAPCFEILEEHRNGNTCIYEMVFISNDDGAATALFVPDQEGIDANLLAMCRSFAVPAVTSP